MEESFPLDLNHPATKEYRRRYEDKVWPYTHCDVPYPLLYRLLRRGVNQERVAKRCGMSRAGFYKVYGRYFQEVFGGIAYRDYQKLLRERHLRKKLPTDGILGELADLATRLGITVEMEVRRHRHQNLHVWSTAIHLNGKRCQVLVRRSPDYNPEIDIIALREIDVIIMADDTGDKRSFIFISNEEALQGVPYVRGNRRTVRFGHLLTPHKINAWNLLEVA